MKNNPEQSLVTVYLVCFNYAKYVKQSIDSVLSQTYQNFELIIIDDGSTDNSTEIINGYAKHPKVRIIIQENKGLIATNNIAVRAANGKYVMRLDADDYLDESALLVLVNTIEKSDELALVFPDYYYTDKNGNVTGQERRHNFQETVTLLDQPAHGACTLIRRSCLIEVGGYSDEFNCQDGWDLWLKLTENYKVGNVNLPLFYYRMHDENLTHDSERLLETRSRIYKKHVEQTKRPHLKILAVLPVRGKIIEKNSQALELLGNKALINWTIDSALDSKLISELIVTTPDPEIISHLKQHYNRKIVVINRNLEDAFENTSYKPAVFSAVKDRNLNDFDAVLELIVEFPFRSTSYIDKAINVMRTHSVDKVIGVIPEDSIFYRHSGSGLEVVGNNYENNLLRLEREYLYRQTGGITLCKKETYEENITKDNITNGHVILSKKAAIQIKNESEMQFVRLQLRGNEINETD